MNDSTAASAGPVLPMPGIDASPEALLRCRITPDPCAIMHRAAARAVTKLLRRPVIGACSRSSVVISTSGVPCTSPRLTRLNDTSTLPVRATTSSTCVDRGLVQRVNDGHVRGAARRLDVLGDRLQWLAGTAGQEHLRPVPRERVGHGAADAPARAVDDRVPTFQQRAHVRSHPRVDVSTPCNVDRMQNSSVTDAPSPCE